MQKYIGQRKYISSSELSDTYLHLGKQDVEAAYLLQNNKLYNEAVYMYLQAMEKKIKGYLCTKINPSLPYYAGRLREMGHSLDSSIDFLIEILAGGNDLLKNQLSLQLKEGVFENIQFSKLYNNCRYPFYNVRQENYFVLDIGLDDCARIKNISIKLDKFLKDFDRL